MPCFRRGRNHRWRAAACASSARTPPSRDDFFTSSRPAEAVVERHLRPTQLITSSYNGQPGPDLTPRIAPERGDRSSPMPVCQAPSYDPRRTRRGPTTWRAVAEDDGNDDRSTQTSCLPGPSIIAVRAPERGDRHHPRASLSIPPSLVCVV
jgi:hypothetical protein